MRGRTAALYWQSVNEAVPQLVVSGSGKPRENASKLELVSVGKFRKPRDAMQDAPRPAHNHSRGAYPRPITGSRCCHGSIPRCALLRDPCHTRGRRACSIATHLDNWAGSSSHPAAHRRHAALGKSCTELSQRSHAPLINTFFLSPHTHCGDSITSSGLILSVS